MAALRNRRQKDIIILNGRNYDPQTIEWVVADLEGVRKGNVVAFSVLGEQSEDLIVVAEARPELKKTHLSKRQKMQFAVSCFSMLRILSYLRRVHCQKHQAVSCSAPKQDSVI